MERELKKEFIYSVEKVNSILNAPTEEKETEQRYDINIFGVPMTATKEELLNIQKQISNII